MIFCWSHDKEVRVPKNIELWIRHWSCQAQTSADSTVRILSGFTVRCLSVKIRIKFGIRTLENPPDWKFQILTERHHTVNPDRIRTALSANVWPGLTDRVERAIPKKEQVNLRFEENFKKENCDFWDAMHEKHGNIYVWPKISVRNCPTSFDRIPNKKFRKDVNFSRFF